MAAKLAIKSPPSYTFDASHHAYLDSAGRKLSQSEIRGFVDKAIGSARDQAKAIAQDFLTHGNSAQFEVAMRDLIRNEHLSLSMIANGGRGQMTVSDWGKAGNALKQQYAYLEDFGRAIDAGNVSDAQLLNRAQMYADFGATLYENTLLGNMQELGMWAVNELGGSEHSCAECPDLTAASPMPAGEMPEVGSRECGMGCNCSVSYIIASEAKDG